MNYFKEMYTALTTHTEEYQNNQKKALHMSNVESKFFTRECICIALLHLLKDKEFEKITVTDIINRSGVSRAGFYRNYSSKEDVINEIGKSITYVLEFPRSRNEYNNNLYQCYYNFLESVKNNSEYIDLLFKARVPNHYFLGHIPSIKSLFPNPTPAQHYFVVAWENSFPAVFSDWFENGMKESTEELATIFAELFPMKALTP